MKKRKLFLLIVIIGLILSSCAHGVHVAIPQSAHIYGFWGGFWHGMIAPFDFFLSLFENDVVVYAVNNNGHWYDFGFILGIGTLSSSTTKSIS